MSTLARIIHLLAVSLWLGSVAFVSFVAAPIIFRTLPRNLAGDVMGAIFPAYYSVGLVCGAVAFLALLAAVGFGGGWTLRVGAVGVLLVVMLGANIYAGFVVQPKASEVKVEMRQAASGPEASPPAKLKADFDRLHTRSVQLNAVVLIGGLLVLLLSAFGLEV